MATEDEDPGDQICPTCGRIVSNKSFDAHMKSHSDNVPYFDLEELKSSLHALGLTYNVLGEYMIVMESEVDIILSDEPYVAFTLLFSVKTGQYFARIWNQTEVVGKAINVSELSEACETFFGQGKPCLGCPIDIIEVCASDEVVVLQTPISRKYSKACHKIVRRVVSSDSYTCSECLKLMGYKGEYVGVDTEDCDETMEIVIEGDVQTMDIEDIETVEQEYVYEESAVLKDEEEEKEKEVVVNNDIPNLSYAQIIEEALLQAEDNTLCLRDIYRYVEEKYPYFNNIETGWQRAFRSILSQNAQFKNIHPPNTIVGGGPVWTLCTVPTANKAPDSPTDNTNKAPDKPTDKNLLHNEVYAQIIEEVLVQAEGNMLCLRDIYRRVEEKYPNLNNSETGWQKAFRSILSTNALFKNIHPPNMIVGGGPVWTLRTVPTADNAPDTLADKNLPDTEVEPEPEEKETRKEVAADDDFQDILQPQPSCNKKPPYSYLQLITQAFSQAEDRTLSLSEMLLFITQKYPYYDMKEKVWQTNLKRILSKGQTFLKMEDDGSEETRWVLARDVGRDEDETDSNAKPKLTYPQIIEDALIQSKDYRLRLRDIFQYMEDKYPYYRSCSTNSWQNSVRHTLSLHPKFLNVAGTPGMDCGRGGMWALRSMIKTSASNVITVPLKSRKRKSTAQPISAAERKKRRQKPPFTFDELISQAFEESIETILSRKDILTFINQTYPYYNVRVKYWKEAVFECLQQSSTIKKIGSRDGCSLWKVVDGNEVECPKCQRLFQSEDEEYFKHMRNKHFFGKFTCPSGCNIRAEYAKELVQHMQEAGHEEEHFAGCPLCEEYIPTQELEPHYATCVSAHNRKHYKSRTQICPTCGKQISNQKIDAHMKSHCEKEDSKEKVSKTMKATYHYCNECERRYSNKGLLNEHIKGVHRGILLPCQMCPKKFKTRSELWQHKNLLHSTDERYNCKFCGLRYGSESELRKHTRIHEDPFMPCSHCDKKYRDKKSLIRHERTHTGERPFQCPVKSCGKWWIDASSLSRHKRNVHKITSQKENT